MENEERLKFKLRVEQIKKNLIEFRYRNIRYLKQAVDKIRDSFLKEFEIEKTDFIFWDNEGRAYNFENEGYGSFLNNGLSGCVTSGDQDFENMTDNYYSEWEYDKSKKYAFRGKWEIEHTLDNGYKISYKVMAQSHYKDNDINVNTRNEDAYKNLNQFYGLVVKNIRSEIIYEFKNMNLISNSLKIEKPMPYSMIKDVIKIYHDDKRYGQKLDLSKRIKE
jgi:hypothetical protein